MELQLNYDASVIPDKVPVIDAGQYFFNIDKIELTEAKGERKASFDFTLSITEGPMKGRKTFDGFPPEFLADPTSRASVKLGHLIKSAGIALTGTKIDFDQLLNKQVQGVVEHTIAKDRQGVMQTYANIKDYVYTT